MVVETLAGDFLGLAIAQDFLAGSSGSCHVDSKKRKHRRGET
jgi:hypothetical protein